MSHLIWFQNNLRVHDNTVLAEACQAQKLLAVYFFDPRNFDLGDFGFKKTEKYRARFLLESAATLKQNLASLNISLLVYHDKPEAVLPKLVEEHGVTDIFMQKEWTRDETVVLKKVKQKIRPTVIFHEIFDQFLLHPADSPFYSFADVPDVFTDFRKRIENRASIRAMVPIPKKMPEENLIEESSSLPDLPKLGLQEFTSDQRTAFPYKGGEDQALKRIDYYFWETQRLKSYKKTRNGLLGPNYSSKLSPWLANGSISARYIYWQIREFEQKIIKNQDTYWLFFELLWRDYFKYISLKYGDKIFWQSGIFDRKLEWKNDTKVLQDWISGKTSEPFVNANMLELVNSGWMSNRGRQNVASYWSKSLKQDWRIGAAYFESLLLDYDVHSNWGNWLYVSGVGNDGRDRKFNIQRQAEMYDRNGTYQRLWLQPSLF
ncbi:DASH family cryptochrome [Flagellimonas lutaonensis]|uniref:Cryptochrome DASH n=1 Tax=Flagellimonas lutaonensis TaxID=516051 RepID=A0A0D5YV37_9FLAO|nr:DASH family cryptochrome [Allomuricauda lutaonensis]AKA35766.1 Cryptochrome [Allomuricauda lutaonensis]